jgi:hypothetical protein
LGLVVLVSKSGFRPWIFEFGYLQVSDFGADFRFHPRISIRP